MARGGVMLHMVFSLLVLVSFPFLLLDNQKLTRRGLVDFVFDLEKIGVVWGYCFLLALT